jgi:hypothetical protein
MNELYKYFIDKEPQCNGDLVAVFAFRFVHNLNACMCKKFSIRSRKLRTLKTNHRLPHGNTVPLSLLIFPIIQWGWAYTKSYERQTKIEKLKPLIWLSEILIMFLNTVTLLKVWMQTARSSSKYKLHARKMLVYYHQGVTKSPLHWGSLSIKYL